ncbi:hypothetical protein [Vreelandella profundi]|uniref:hypothetical protein n=1 Tax=Vreelandella profundi TaxID=2852117 RepID=UPI001F1F5C49|nr:hypothetical protein [Halomonas profundi]
MNIEATMKALYTACEQFNQLAGELEVKGCPRTANELRRESSKLGARVMTMDALLEGLNVDELQQLKPTPRFIGVDMSTPTKSQTFMMKVGR